MRTLEGLLNAMPMSAHMLSEMAFGVASPSAFSALERFIVRVDALMTQNGRRSHEALWAISALEVLDAIVAILVIGQMTVLSEVHAASMAYKRFLARVGATMTIEIGLIIGGVITSIASVLLYIAIYLRPQALAFDFLIMIETLFALHRSVDGFNTLQT